MPKLENWSVMISGDQYTPPEAWSQRLHGTLLDDDRLSPSSGEPLLGKEVTTSRLVSIDLKARRAQTKNTLYDLGNPAPEYVEWVKENEPSKYEDLVRPSQEEVIQPLQEEKHGADLAFEVNTEAQTLGCRCIDMGDELASLVSTHREDFVWKDSIEDVKALIAERDSLKDKFDMHLDVVRSFLAEMYATMIDPLDETPHKVEEVCRLLLERAREDRETARERDDLKVRLQNLEWRPITEEDMPKVGDEVYSMPQPGCFYPDEPGTVYNPLRTEDLRTFKGWTWAPRPFTHFRPLNAPKEKTDAVPTHLG